MSAPFRASGTACSRQNDMVSQLTSDLARIAVHSGSVVDVVGRSHAGGVVGKVERLQLMLPRSTVAVYNHIYMCILLVSHSPHPILREHIVCPPLLASPCPALLPRCPIDPAPMLHKL